MDTTIPELQDWPEIPEEARRILYDEIGAAYRGIVNMPTSTLQDVLVRKRAFHAACEKHFVIAKKRIKTELR